MLDNDGVYLTQKDFKDILRAGRIDEEDSAYSRLLLAFENTVLIGDIKERQFGSSGGLRIKKAGD